MIYTLKQQSTDSLARAGELDLNGIKVQTPAFMPVGTRGTIKSLTSEDIRELGLDLILGNTYHLYLRPGKEVLDSFGGLKNSCPMTKHY